MAMIETRGFGGAKHLLVLPEYEEEEKAFWDILGGNDSPAAVCGHLCVADGHREPYVRLQKGAKNTAEVNADENSEKLKAIRAVMTKVKRLAKKVDKLASDAMGDPIHDHIYKEEMAGHGLKAFKMLGEITKIVESP